MKILSFESSAVSASVALTEHDKLVAHSFQNCGLTHSRTLLPMTEALLANCGISLSEIDGFAISAGPGSFTGLRIGVATVKGLCFASDKPCVAVSTLEAMACSARSLGSDICCVMDARAGQVYNALFSADLTHPKRRCEDRAIALSDLAREIGDAAYFLVGDGADLCYNTIIQSCKNIKLAPPELRFPAAYGAAIAAKPYFERGETLTAQQLNASYLRKPQAERERLAKLATKPNK